MNHQLVLQDDVFEELWAQYAARAEHYVAMMAEQELLEYRAAAADAPLLLMSILYDDCLTRGRPLLSGGIRYLGGTLEAYGFVNAADSLTAIRRLVYEEKAVPPAELLAALEGNFAGQEALRAALLACPKYGNDDDEADAMARQVHRHICQATAAACPAGLDYYLVVHINNHTNTILGRSTGASADGRPRGQFMANANNPMSGMDTSGMTAMLNSLLKMDTDIHAGVVQNLKLAKEMFAQHRPQTEALLKAYFAHGGAQLMLNVLGRRDLENALRHPRQYANLIVRVGGFSARYIDLAPDVQQEILKRTMH